jgi:hypothetical protein
VQSQALQYANRFVELRDAVEAADLEASKRSLLEFQRVATGAASNGLDPLRQIPVLSKDFAGIRDALLKGNIGAAQDSLASLKRSMGAVAPVFSSQNSNTEATSLVSPSPKPSGQKTVRSLPKEPLKNPESIVLESLGFLGADEELLRELHSIQASSPPKGLENTSSTFIRVRPELTSFTQTSQVFPTSTDSFSELGLPPSNTSTQAQVVVRGLAASQPNAQLADLDGTTFAPTPELLLGTKGITIPPGAELQFDDSSTLQTLSFDS